MASTGGRKEEARKWILQARYDLKAAEWNLEGGFFNTVCFLCQQAAEKALKSLLYYSGASRKKLMTHSIVELIRVAERSVPDLQNCLNEARELDLHYIPSRYPNGLPGGFPHTFYGKKTGEKAIDHARLIVQAIIDYYRVQNFETHERGDNEQ